MKTIQAPAIFLAQFVDHAPPFNTLDNIAGWAAGLGYKGVQIPSWDGRLFDLKRAGESKTYCDEVQSTLANALRVTELSTHLQGQLVAVHPAYDLMFDGFAAEHVRGNPRADRHGQWEQWRRRQKRPPILVSRRMPLFPVHWRGRTFIPGRKGPPVSSRRHCQLASRWRRS